MKHRIACGLLAALLAGLLASGAWAGQALSDVPPWGYSPQNMDRSVDPRQDFYRFATGHPMWRDPAQRVVIW